ncbi:MAG: hypothetical protein QOH97_3787 [Actinoplanes sp.]|jgi:hypothetical protein|nr:hypothetical protein [Actinoplanes sp.]
MRAAGVTPDLAAFGASVDVRDLVEDGDPVLDVAEKPLAVSAGVRDVLALAGEFADGPHR